MLLPSFTELAGYVAVTAVLPCIFFTNGFGVLLSLLSTCAPVVIDRGFQRQDGMLAKGTESSALSRTVTNFDDIDEEDKAGRKTRLFKRNETQGYIDTESLDAASLDKAR